VYIKAKFFVLPMGGLHVKHAVQRGIWVPTKHLLWDHEKPWLSWPVAGPSGCKLTYSQQSGIKYASSFFFLSLKTFISCFYKNVIAYNLNKHQTMYTDLFYLHHQGTDRTENAVFLYLCHCYVVSFGVLKWSLLSHCLVTVVVCRGII
jgi:hypothetical protein